MNNLEAMTPMWRRLQAGAVNVAARDMTRLAVRLTLVARSASSAVAQVMFP